MKYKIEIKSIWEPGQRVDSEGKAHQEDSIYPAFNEQKDSDRLFVLCDGMGGHEAGEVASSTVCGAMSKSVLDSMSDPEGDFDDNMMQEAIAAAFDALDSLPAGDADTERKMGTTMTFLKLHNKGCTIAHMGDSRVYHIRPGKNEKNTDILFHTTDHSLINDLIKIGELTEEEAKESKQKNVITRAMQPQMERRPKAGIYSTADIKAGDYFFMCSDGMLEQMEDDNIKFIFSEKAGDCEAKIKMLTEVTSQNRDNHSAIVVHVLDVIDPLPVERKVQAATGKFKKQLFIKYILTFLLIVAAVAGIYFITSAMSQKNNKNEVKQEPVKQGQDVMRRTTTKTKRTPQTVPVKTNNTVPNNENASVETSQHENINANGNVSGTATDNAAQQGVVQKPPIKKPAKANISSENLVSSDEQNTIDAINSTLE